AEIFVKLCDETLTSPWTASIRDVSFLVTRLKRHRELFDESRWVASTPWMPHAAEHLARLARHYDSFRHALEVGLPMMFSGHWAEQNWAQVKLLQAWQTVPPGVVPFLRQRLAKTIPTQPAVVP